MDNHNLKVCRLCLEIINNHNCETLDDVKLAMLKILPLNLSPAYTIDALLCSQCSDKLQRIFCFKTACLDNNDYLKTFLHYGSNFTLVLEEVIVRESSTQDEVKHEHEKVCRLCLKYFDIELFTKLNEVENDIFLKDMLEKCLPEFDLNVTKVPLMCQVCMDMLQNQFNFVISCLDVDERIKNFQTSVAADYDQHDLSDVLKFGCMDPNDIKLEEENDGDFKYISELAVKKEEVFEGIQESDLQESLELNVKDEQTMSGECINTEENIKSDLDSEAMMSDDDACRSGPLKFPESKTLKKNAYGMFVCTHCPHQTDQRANLVLHFLTHTKKADMSELNQFKCKECSFVTKWKSSLKSHALLHKNPAERELFYCANCAYKSMHKKHIRRHCQLHMKSESLSKDMYKCQYCSFTAKDKTYFKHHNKFKHKKSIVLPFEKCEQCDYESNIERNVLIHMKVAHNITKEGKSVTRYSCEICDFKTHKMSHFKGHLLKHKSFDEIEMFNCSECTFQTRYKNSLRSHLKRHGLGIVKEDEPETRYACELCHFRTHNISHYKEHLLKHKSRDEVEMLSCTKCSFQTRYKNSLKSHLKRHAPGQKSQKQKVNK